MGIADAGKKALAKFGPLSLTGETKFF